MRSVPTMLHLDMDAFYASVEQAAKPSLCGRPVVVGGLGSRGVVATASYEARRYGVRSAMPTAWARRLCPNAAFLAPRFPAYREVSELVMGLLAGLSPLVEPLSLDEAFVDLEAGTLVPPLRQHGPALVTGAVRALAGELREDIKAATGLTASVGLAASKMLAKIASEEAKPDGLLVIVPGSESELLGPLSVRVLPGVGPATAELLRRAGIRTVAEVAQAGETELVRLLGKVHGASLFARARGRDDRPVVPEREAKSLSVEDTFEADVADMTRVRLEIDRLAERCVRRLRAAGRSGRTVVLKVRRYDFSTLTRSETLRAPTDDPMVVREIAQRLLRTVDTTGGVRLLGVGVTGLADFAQGDLFACGPSEGRPPGSLGAGTGSQAPSAERDRERHGRAPATEQTWQATVPRHAEAWGPEGFPGSESAAPAVPGLLWPSLHDHRGAPAGRGPEEPAGLRAHATGLSGRRFSPGQDVRHAEYGHGWIQGSGVGRVTIRFEEPGSPPGRVRTFPVDDPALQPSPHLPLMPKVWDKAHPVTPE